jgi:predicted dehydrogenase
MLMHTTFPVFQERTMPRFTRRQFLHAGAAGVVLGPTILRAADTKQPASERLVVGFIGVEGKGGDNVNQISPHVHVAALCDVDEKRAAKARDRFSDAKFYTDFRKLIDQKGLDAVVVSTPDHMHAPATVAALKAGLHVYCEKPLTHTVSEARLVAELAAKQKRVTQMGTQIHGGGNYRRVVELIQSGAIGDVREVHTWVSTAYPAPGGVKLDEHGLPIDKPAVPEGLHWDLWQGPALERPYHSSYVPFNWRRWWAYGGGALNDMACHHMDLPFWALKLRHPTKVSTEGSKLQPETCAEWMITKYEFPARDTLPPVTLTWYDGGKRPPLFADGKLPSWGNGNLFIGSKGMLLADYGKHKLLPEKDFEGFAPPKPTIPDSIGHYKEWVEACKKGTPTTCNFDYSGALTEAVLLGTVSYRLGKPFTWNAGELKAVGEPEADRFIHKEYRKGWEL